MRFLTLIMLLFLNGTATDQTKNIPWQKLTHNKDLSLADSFSIADLNSFVVNLAQKDSFSGIVLVALRDQILYHKAFGLASKEYDFPINFQTRFDLASLTKVFTGVAIGQLAQQGKIKFEDPISKFLPELPGNLGKGITIHHLLTHTSGLGSYWTTEFHESNHAKFRTLNDYLQLIRNDSLLFPPGSRWGYSNTGYLILGLLIEKISGESYFDFVKDNIFLKAGMDHSGFFERDAVNKNIATGYTRQNRYRPGDRSYSTTDFIAAVKGTSAGGAFATAEDLFRFSVALQNNKLLNRQYTELILSGKAPYDRPERKKKYAYGFAEQFVNDERIVFHDGGANGISTQMDIYPTSGYTVIILSNYDPPSAFLVSGYLRGMLTKKQ